jgi:hypothetical protein
MGSFNQSWVGDSYNAPTQATPTDMLGYRGDHFRVGDDPGANGRAVLRWLARFPDKWPTLPNTFLNAT